MNLIERLQSRGITAKKVSGAKGGEWASPCPACGGEDRFRCWPDKGEAGEFWCRQCGKAGDAIQYLIEFDDMTFPQAAAAIGRTITPQDRLRTPRVPGPGHSNTAPRPPENYGPPAEAWLAKATILAEWAHEQLMASPERLAWLAERGITEATARECLLGWNPGEKGKDLYRERKAWGLPPEKREDGKPKKLWLPRGLIIPLMVDGQAWRLRIRRDPCETGVRYYVVPGSSMRQMFFPTTPTAVVVVESELDAVLLRQESGALASALALGSSSTKPDAQALAALKASLSILVSLDYDPAGAKAAWGWWLETFRQARRAPVPEGKDPGEAYALGVDLRSWVLACLPLGLTLGIEEEKGPKGPLPSGVVLGGGVAPLPAAADATPAPAFPEDNAPIRIAEAKAGAVWKETTFGKIKPWIVTLPPLPYESEGVAEDAYTDFRRDQAPLAGRCWAVLAPGGRLGFAVRGEVGDMEKWLHEILSMAAGIVLQIVDERNG